jgi:hypothetical protein
MGNLTRWSYSIKPSVQVCTDERRKCALVLPSFLLIALVKGVKSCCPLQDKPLVGPWACLNLPDLSLPGQLLPNLILTVNMKLFIYGID